MFELLKINFLELSTLLISNPQFFILLCTYQHYVPFRLMGKYNLNSDDTAIVIFDSTWQSTWHKAESDIILLDAWFFSNNL